MQIFPEERSARLPSVGVGVLLGLDVDSVVFCEGVMVAASRDEPIIRRLSLDGTGSRFGRLMGNAEWNGRLVYYWLMPPC